MIDNVFMDTFSQDLINQIIELFEEQYNQKISEETAILHLDSLANLFAAFRRLIEDQDTTHAGEPGTTEPSETNSEHLE